MPLWKVARIAVTALVLLISVGTDAASSEKKTAEEERKKCEDSTIPCSCGSETSFVLHPVKMCHGEEGECRPCRHEGNQEDICIRYRHCETCLPGLNTCHTCPPGASGPLCNEGINDKKPIYPIRFKVPAGASSRFRRETDLCHLPQLEFADYYCTKWPDRIKCDIHCLHGYALPSGGTKKRIRCIFNEGTWRPLDWADCKAYMDCNLEMAGPGHFFCTYDMQTPTFCYVKCEESGIQPAVPREKYVCDGHWDPELPYCVKEKKS